MKKRSLMLLAALALLLALSAGCGKQEEQPPVSPAPAEDAASLPDDASTPADTAVPEEQPDARKPADAQPDEPAPEETQPSEPASAPAEPEPEPDPEPEPVPAPEPEPEPAPEPADTAPEDGTYTADVTLEGGTGRATVESPATLHCKDGAFTAVIVWSSPNFDYMKVDGEKYELISEPGSNSVFEIPVAAFDQKLDVIADTVAMSEPHEVAYALTFDSASLEKQ